MVPLAPLFDMVICPTICLCNY